jgi:hypothetical protein
MTPRGILTLFNDIYAPEQDDNATRARKGRSEHHISLRNECLVDRYYFHAKFSEKRYDIILKILSTEFFLSEVTIPEIIGENTTQLHNLKKDQPKKQLFIKKWPHLVW